MNISKNLIWQFSGQGLGKLFMLVFYILLPRLIGPVEYGKFAYAMAAASIVVQPFIDMGLDMVVAKWVSRGKLDVPKKAFIIRTAAALSVIPLLLLISMFLKIDKKVLFSLFPYFVLISLQNVTFSYFRGIEYMKPESIIVPLQKSFALVLLFLLAFLGLKSDLLGSIPLSLSMALGILTLYFVFTRRHKKNTPEMHKTDSPAYKDIMREGIVLCGVAFLWLIYFRIDSVMLGMMRGDLDVGLYNVAYKIMEGIFFIPGIIMLVTFPRLARPDAFKGTFGSLFVALGSLGLLASAALYLLSPFVIRIIYGPSFFGSIKILQTLSLVLLPVFLGHLVTQSLVAMDMNRIYLLVSFAGTIFNISLNLVLIPMSGAVGAALSTLATEAMVVVFCCYFIWRKRPDVLSLYSLTGAARAFARRG